MPKKHLDVETIKQRIFEKFNGKYEFIGFTKYINAKQKEKVRCNICGEIFITSISAILFENHVCYCPKCKNNKRKINFIEKVKLETNNEYIPLSEYNNCKEKVLFKHNKKTCMNEFWMTPDTFFNGGSRCPICMHRQGANKLFLSHEEFADRIKNIHGEHITLLGRYTGYDGKIMIRHEDCGREFDVYCGDLLQGKGCRYCAGTMLKTHEQFVSELSDLYNDEYSVIGKYKNAKTKINIRHNLCGYEWNVSPSAILKKKLCPNCAKSYGEKQIENYLIHNKIKYQTQTTFDGCVDNDYLKFDFSIYDDNSELLSVLEYDGEAHFKPIQFGGISIDEAKLNFETQVKRDKIKNCFCKENNIKMLRISYKDSDKIYDILNSYLSNLLSREMKTPTKFYINSMKSPSVKFLEIIKDLPNGVYPKSFFKSILSNPNQTLSQTIFQKPIVKEYVKNHEIKIGKSYIEINTNSKDDYESYLQIGRNNNFDFVVFNYINELHNLQDGVYAKYHLNLKGNPTVKPTEYDFFNRYLKKRNIKFYHSYIRINSNEEFKRPDWLLKDRNKEAV